MTNSRNRISTDELIQAFIFIGIGIFFLSQAQQAETNQQGLVGPALVPSAVSVLIIFLGIIKGAKTLFWSETISDNNHVVKPGLQAYLKITAIILLGFLYILAFNAFGYLLATFIAFIAILIIFGNRNVLSLLLYSAIGSVIYYIVFIKLMKTYDPPGVLINIQSLLPF